MATSTSLFGGDDTQTIRWPDSSSSSSTFTPVNPSPEPLNDDTDNSSATATSTPTSAAVAASSTTTSPPTSILHRLPPELRHQIYLYLLPTSPIIPSHPIRRDHASYPSTPPSSLSSSASSSSPSLGRSSTSSHLASPTSPSPTAGSLALATTHPLFAAELSHLLYTRPTYTVSITPSGIRALRGQPLTYPEWDFGIRGGPVRIHARDHEYRASEHRREAHAPSRHNPGIGLRRWIQRVEKLELSVQVWAQPALSARTADYAHWFVDWVCAVRGAGNGRDGEARPFKRLEIGVEWCGWEGMVAEEERAVFGSWRGFEGRRGGAEVAGRVVGCLGDLRAERVGWRGEGGMIGSGGLEGGEDEGGEWEGLKERLRDRILGMRGEVGKRKTLETVLRERSERERDGWVGSA